MKKLIIPLLILLALPLMFQSTPTEIIKLKTFDTFVKEQQPSSNFVILNITEEDVEREGGYPLPRKRLADIQLEILGKGALGVGWVISFPQADRLMGDEDFARSLEYAPSVLAMFETPNNKYPKTTGTAIKGDNVGGILTKGVKENFYTYNNTLQGIASAPTEVDQLVRRIPLLLRTPDGWVASFGTQVYKALFDVKTYIITTNQNGIQEIAIRGIPPVKTDSFGRKWISWVKTPETNLQEMEVNGKFVFVGVTANGVMPQIATPVGLLEPHKIQDPRQVKRLQKDPSLLKLGGERRRCTFLFTDVRGFTALSETLSPEEVTVIMNKALTIQSNAVQKHGGMVDKYIGDAMMAIFNAPIDLKHHEQIAVACAKEIQENIQEADIGVAIGVGVNTGEAVIGNMGSDTRFDYSAIGDAVNTAARLESATKEVGVDILIGEETERYCGVELKALKPIKVKGKEKPLNIYTF